MEARVVGLLREKGPLTGSELLQELNVPPLSLWKTCRLSKRLLIRTLGGRYLRLDTKVDGFARLSPSILREFMTYTVVGLPDELVVLDWRAKGVIRHIKEVSEEKLELARKIVHDVSESLTDQWPRQGRLCFILAGDVVYSMAHDVPRPERSIGKMVSGSDLDLVVVSDDVVPNDFLEELDSVIYQVKYRTLMFPPREEIDYVVKNMKRVREQLRFDTFKRMVACKILHEGILLSGDQTLFGEIKAALIDYRISKKLEAMRTEAARLRRNAEEYLLSADSASASRDDLRLFYTTEESEEFE